MILTSLTWLLVLAFTESEMDTTHGYISDAWLNTEWEEYDGRFEFWWNYLISPLDIKTASLFDITAISELSVLGARQLLGSREQPPRSNKLTDDSNVVSGGSIKSKGIPRPEMRYYSLITRRFGEDIKSQEDRYDGSAFGLTQRYW